MELYEDKMLEDAGDEDLGHNVIIECLEFEWAFRGPIARMFIKNLAFTEKDEQFGIRVF
jgi:hypothetical protein